MNRHTYRNNRRTQTLSDTHKADIFSRITETLGNEYHSAPTFQRPQSVFARYSYYVRPVAMVGWVVMMMATVFMLWFVFQPKTTEQSSGDAPIATRKTSGPVVQADSLGRIIQAEWVISIEDGQRGYQTILENIPAGVQVVLEDSAKLEFAIWDEWIIATIYGPAVFTLEEIWDKTFLNLLEWSYAEVKTLPVVAPSQPTDSTISSVNTIVEKTPRLLVIKTTSFQIEANSAEVVDVKINEWDEDVDPEVKNSGDTLLVKRLWEEEWVVLGTSEVATWNEGTTLLVNTLDTDSDNAGESALLAIRYETDDQGFEIIAQPSSVDTLDGTDIPLIWVAEDELMQTLGLGEPQDNYAMNTIQWEDEGADEVSQTLLEWRVLSPERMDILGWLIAASYISYHADQLIAYTDQPDKQAVTIETLVSLLNRSLAVFNAWWPSVASLDNLTQINQELITILQDKFFTPPSLIQPLFDLQVTIDTVS